MCYDVITAKEKEKMLKFPILIYGPTPTPVDTRKTKSLTKISKVLTKKY